MEEGDHVAALHGVEARQRLVQNQYFRVVHQGARHLDALAHAFRKLPNGLGADVGKINLFKCPARNAFGVGHCMAVGADPDHFDGAQVIEKCVLLGDQRDATAYGSVGSRIASEHANRTLRWCGQAAHHAEQRRFAGAVRAEQRSDAAADREVDIADRDDGPEEFRDLIDGDHGVGYERVGVRGRKWRRRGWKRGHRAITNLE
jgi:hypothetical protein